MRMLRAGRQRGIPWRLAQPRFEFRDSCRELRNLPQQHTNYRLRLRRLPRNQLLRDLQLGRHAPGVAEISLRAKTSFSHQGVNGYLGVTQE